MPLSGEAGHGQSVAERAFGADYHTERAKGTVQNSSDFGVDPQLLPHNMAGQDDLVECVGVPHLLFAADECT